MDWSLLDCGRKGHVTFAPAEADLRAWLSTTTEEGQAWRCLRCATFVPGPAAGSGPAASAPQVNRGVEVRSAIILRIFSIERFLRALVFGVAAFAVWQFGQSRASLEAAFDRDYPAVRTLLTQLGYDVDHSKLLGVIQKALTLSPGVIQLIAAGVAVYALLEVIEGVGLWLAKRWGEYFAMIVTSLGLPYEIYDMTSKITATRVVFFLINLALVVYLVVTRRLFGVRGGKAAYEAKLRSESLIAEVQKAIAAQPSRTPQPTPAVQSAHETQPAPIIQSAPGTPPGSLADGTQPGGS